MGEPRTVLEIARTALIEAGHDISGMTDAEIIGHWSATIFPKRIGKPANRKGPYVADDHPWRAESRKQLRDRAARAARGESNGNGD